MRVKMSSRILGYMMVVMLVVSMLPAFAINTRADDNLQDLFTNNPLDFASDNSSRSGDGWSWDQETATLTLEGLMLDLDSYTGDYSAAITLPAVNDGVTIQLGNYSNYVDVKGTDEEGNGRVGIYCPGDLTITGNRGLLSVDGTDGANGIEVNGNLVVGEGTDIKNYTRLQITAEEFGICAAGTIVFNAAYVEPYIFGEDQKPDPVNAAIAAENEQSADNGIDISHSYLSIITMGKNTVGIKAYDGTVRLSDTGYLHNANSGERDNIGILSSNGDIILEETEAVFNMDEGTVCGDVLLYAEQDWSLENIAENPSITISASSITGSGSVSGILAPFGKIDINGGSTANISTTDLAIYAGKAGLSIADSNLTVKSTEDYSDAVYSEGDVQISDSALDIVVTGEMSNGLMVDNEGTITLNGKTTAIDASGTQAAIVVRRDGQSETVISPITCSDGLDAIIGGTLKHVDYTLQGAERRCFSYTESALGADEYGNLQNASPRVLIANTNGVVITEQPHDVHVNYPEGTSFEVNVQDPSKVESYQWICTDSAGTEFVLDGTSATTNKLIIPSTEQRDIDLVYKCMITDTEGTVYTSRSAELYIDNSDEDKTVLYAGNYAIEPGGSLDLETTELGSGTILFDENGTDITLDHVNFDNSKNVYDATIGPAIGICLNRYKSEEENYNVRLVGDNKLVNTFYQESTNGCGITLDFMLYGNSGEFGQSDNALRTTYVPDKLFAGDEEGDVHTTVYINGKDPETGENTGTLAVYGGTYAIRAIGDIVVNADIETFRPGYVFEDGIVCDNLKVGEGSSLDLQVNGAGISVDNGLTIGRNAVVNIDTIPPMVAGDQTYKGAIFSGGGTAEFAEGSETRINVQATPEAGADIGGFAGIILVNGSVMTADKCLIDISMTAEPDTSQGEPYAKNFLGINGGDYSDIDINNTEFKVDIDGQEVYCASGVRTIGDINIKDSAVKISAKTGGSVYGLASEGDIVISDSDVDVTAKYYDTFAEYGVTGSSAAIAGNTIKLSDEDTVSRVAATADNDDGIAIMAKTGEGGDEPKGYEHDYKAASIIYGTDNSILLPENNAISLASIAGEVQNYIYVETVYDLSDTTKPASAVEFGEAVKSIDSAVVTLSSTKVTYNGKEQKPSVKSVVLNGTELQAGTDYTVAYSNNKNAGKATVTVTGTGKYKGMASASFTIEKAKNPLTVKAAKRTVKYSKVKKKAVTVKGPAISKKGQGTVTYKKFKVNKNAKKFTVNKKTGKITVKKGTGKGTYKVTVQVKAAGNANYNAKTVKKVVTVVVK